MKALASLTLAMLLAAPALADDQASTVEETRKKLEAVEKRMGTAEQKLEQSRQKERTILGAVEDLDRQIFQARNSVSLLKADEKELRAAISQAERRLATLAAEKEKARNDLSARSAALYKAMDVSYLKVILNSAGIEDLQRRFYYLKAVTRSDSELYRSAGQLLASERQQLEALEGSRKKLSSTLGELDANLSLLEQRKRSKRLLLASARDQRERYSALIVELDEAAERLRTLLEALMEQEATGESPFPRLKGALPRPVPGRIIVEFGKNRNDRFNTFTLSRGITIQSAEGTPVRSVFAGRVIFADWFRGFGRIIILDHGGGYYTLYGHLSAIQVKVGDEVGPEQVIGQVGDSGSLEGSSLYFEIRHRGKPEDPNPWFTG